MSGPDETDGFEPIHTVDAVHDGWPLQGIAGYGGRPHAFERGFDEERDDYAPDYELWPIDEETFRWAVEQSDIFDRWRDAFDARRTGDETFPALPKERARYEELEALLSGRRGRPPAASVFRAVPEFKSLSLRARATGQVRWKPLSPSPGSE